MNAKGTLMQRGDGDIGSVIKHRWSDEGLWCNDIAPLFVTLCIGGERGIGDCVGVY